MRVGSMGLCAASAMLLWGCGGAPAPEPEPWFGVSSAKPAPGQEHPPPSEDPPGEPSAKPPADTAKNVVTIESITLDGVTLEHVECRVDGLGLMATLVIAQVFSARRAELALCMPGDNPLTVRWSFEANRVTEVTAEDADARQSKCLSQALVGGPAPGRGQCTAVVQPPR